MAQSSGSDLSLAVAGREVKLRDLLLPPGFLERFPDPSEEVSVHTLDDIRARAAPHHQDFFRNNDFIKYLRWRGEDPLGSPCVHGYMLLPGPDCTDYLPCVHNVSGAEFHFDESVPRQPWIWRKLISDLHHKDALTVVGDGIAAIVVAPRPGSQDHHRMHKLSAQEKAALKREGRLWPIWAYWIARANGTGCWLKTNWKGYKVEIMEGSAVSLSGQDSSLSGLPAAGPGGSDGPGTYSAAVAAAWDGGHHRGLYEEGLDPTRDEHRRRDLERRFQGKGGAGSAAVAAKATQQPPPPPPPKQAVPALPPPPPAVPSSPGLGQAAAPGGSTSSSAPAFAGDGYPAIWHDAKIACDPPTMAGHAPFTPSGTGLQPYKSAWTWYNPALGGWYMHEEASDCWVPWQ